MTREQKIDNRVKARAPGRQDALDEWRAVREAASLAMARYLSNPYPDLWELVLETRTNRDAAAGRWGMMWRSDFQKEQLRR